MSVNSERGGGVDEPRFRSPFSDVDRELLEARAPHLVEFLDLAVEVHDASSTHRSLGGQEALAALRALEVTRRLVEAMSTDMLAHYQRIGDCSAYGYRTTASLLAGEFRVTPGEARRRTRLSDHLAGRVSELGEAQEPVRPAIAEEFADGRISADEAKALCDAVDDLPPTIRSTYADKVEKTLVELAPTVSLKDVPKLSQRIIQNIDPDGKLPRFETETQKYHVTLSQQRNGDWRLKGLLDCPSGTTLRALLYGRMKDADVPVAVRPNAACNADAASDANEESSTTRTVPGAEDAAPAAGIPVLDDADDYSVPSARDDENTRGRGAHSDPDDVVPQVPLEAVWEDTRVTVRADATIEVDGRTRTFLEDEPHICLDEAGWPVYLSARVSEEAQKLLEEARASETGIASSVIWEKVLGRVPTNSRGTTVGPPGQGSDSKTERAGPPDPTGPSSQPGPVHQPNQANQPDLSNQPESEHRPDLAQQPDPPGLSRPPDQVSPPDSSGRPDSSAPPGAASAPTSYGSPPLNEAGVDRPPLTPLTADGVFEDGSRSGFRISGSQGGLPGLARHDRFAFLLRSVARERVLHGADHALVVTARAEDLARSGALLSTHAGAPTTLGGLEAWSNAAQMFVHVTDGGGRSLEVRSQGRFATRTQMAVLAARDQGCTFPDCDAPAEWCEAHHILAYASGGKTEIDNLTLVCPFHHRWFERTGWESLFLRGFPAWRPPKAIDPRQRPVFHSRFRVALLGLPPELPLGG